MPNAMVPLQTITLSSNVTTVNFISIPQGYKDLVLISNFVSSTPVNAYLALRFNSVSTTSYNYQLMSAGIGSSVDNANSSAIYVNGYSPSSVMTSSNIQIIDYSTSKAQKLCLTKGAIATTVIEAGAQAFNSTSAIVSLNIGYWLSSGPSILSGSTFSLYGIEG